MSEPTTEYAVFTFEESGDVTVHSHGATEDCEGYDHRTVPAAEVPDYVKAVFGHPVDEPDVYDQAPCIRAGKHLRAQRHTRRECRL